MSALGVSFSFYFTLFTAGLWGGRFAFSLYSFTQKEKIQTFDGSAYLMIRFYLRDWCGILQARNLNCNQDIIILRPSCWPDCIGCPESFQIDQDRTSRCSFVTIACIVQDRAGRCGFIVIDNRDGVV